MYDLPTQVPVNSLSFSLSASVVGVMGIVGNFVSPVLMTRFGRQKAHLICTIPALLGWVAFVLGNSVSAFILARLLHGFALGLRTPVAPILVAEYTDPKYRGAFLGSFAVSLGLGIFLSHLWGAQLSWKMTAVVCAMFPLISMAIIGLSPESASWLISKGNFEEGRKAFRWVRGEGVEQNEELEAMIECQKKELKLSEQRRNEAKFSWNGLIKSITNALKKILRIFKKKEFYKPAVIAITMLIIFEFGGAHMVPAYGNRILQAVLNKETPEEVALQFTIIDMLRTICALLAIFLLKYFKRRTILFTSGVMTVISLSSISIFIYIRNAELYTETWLTAFIPMSLMVLYTLSFCLGLVPLNWVICGEIFPLAYRSLGSTLSTSFLTPSFIVSMKTAPHLYSSIGIEGTFLIYSATLVIGLVVLFLMLPETKDKTLQDIEDSFKSKNDVEMVEHEMQAKLIENKDIVVVK